MVAFLFWNLADNPKTAPCLERLAQSHQIDTLFLAECPDFVAEIAASISRGSQYPYRVSDLGLTKVRGLSRLPSSDFFPHFTNRTGDLSIWNLATGVGGGDQLQIAVVHLPSKAGGATQEDQAAVATQIARDIAEYEDREDCRNTILVGDLNMNPYEPGMVTVSGLHATMTRTIADRPDRVWRKQKYRRFYNPMWGLFGDRTPGPSGTHYWESATPGNHHWQMFDQLLLRPPVIDRLQQVRILDSDGHQPLVNQRGHPTKKYLSDHLPIFFVIKN